MLIYLMKKNIGETLLKLIDLDLIVSCHDISLGGILTAVSKMCIKGNKGIKINSCHDVSLGGILIAIAKMCLMGKKGIKLNPIKSLMNKFEYFFAEDQARYIIEINNANIKKVNEILNNNSVHYDDFGVVDINMLSFENDIKLPIEELSNAHTYWLKRYMDN